VVEVDGTEKCADHDLSTHPTFPLPDLPTLTAPDLAPPLIG
jgi:hypothetical protein